MNDLHLMKIFVVRMIYSTILIEIVIASEKRLLRISKVLPHQLHFIVENIHVNEKVAALQLES